MPKTPNTLPTVELDPESGLPALPEGYFWRIGRSKTIEDSKDPNGSYSISGAEIWEHEKEAWSDWRWSVGSDKDYTRMLSDTRRFEVEVAALYPNDIIQGKSLRSRRVRSAMSGTLLWRYRRIYTQWVFHRMETTEEDAPQITVDNILAETTKTFLAWEKSKSVHTVLGDYPPRKSRTR